MCHNRKNTYDTIDEDLYEDITEEEMEQLVREAQREILQNELQKSTTQATRRFPKIIAWLIAIVMIINTFSFILQTYSIPAIEFLKTSAILSSNKQIAAHKKSVVTIITENSKGTGFSITSDGTIVTNYHVIKGESSITVVFPDAGRYNANISQTDPSVDLALLKIDAVDLPYLTLAERTSFVEEEPIYFIGNPLRFHGIANKGTVIDYIQLSNWDDPVVMIKAPVYRGNSGSPIINKEGHVIGIIFATFTHEEFGNVGLFIPIDYFYRMHKR